MTLPIDHIFAEMRERWKREDANVKWTSPTAYEAFLREQRKWEEEANRRTLAAALEKGFSSAEEYREALRKQDREIERIARERVEEETGKPWQEYWATHPQQEKTPPNPFPQCDCKGIET